MFYGDWKYVRADCWDGCECEILHGAVNYRTGQHVSLDFSERHAMTEHLFQIIIDMNFPTRKSLDLDHPLRPENLLQL
jgi:hypothetical protein